MSDKERIAGYYRCPEAGRLRAATPEEMQQLFDEIERLRKQRDHLRRTIQTFRGEVFRAAAESERRAIAELEADDE